MLCDADAALVHQLAGQRIRRMADQRLQAGRDDLHAGRAAAIRPSAIGLRQMFPMHTTRTFRMATI